MLDPSRISTLFGGKNERKKDFADFINDNVDCRFAIGLLF